VRRKVPFIDSHLIRVTEKSLETDQAQVNRLPGL
jgi:hypothetical protein